MKIIVLSSNTKSLFWFRIDMMREFVKSNHEVIAIGDEESAEWIDRFNLENIKYRSVYVKRNGLNPLTDIKTLKNIYEIFKDEQPDKIFVYQAKTVIYGCIAAKMNRIRDIYPLIAGLGSLFRGTSIKSKLIKKIMTLEYRFSLKYCKFVIFQNNDDANCFIESNIIEKRKCRLISGSGVDCEKFKVTALPNKTSFLMTARLIKDKGVIEYLEACKIIKEKYTDCRCMLIGPYDTNPTAIKPEVIQQYIQLGVVEYFGEQDDVRDYTSKCSVFVLPSYHEGTPKTVLEAMSMGRSIITTDAPGCRETVINETNGFLVDVKNIDSLVEKMTYFIKNPEEAAKMGLKSRQIAEEKFDVRKVNNSIMEIMNISA